MRRLVVGATAIFVALTLGAGPVFAGTELSRSGKVGTYQINDSDTFSPVYCEYDTDVESELLRIWLHSTTIWSRDKSPGRDHQVVGWKVTVQKRKVGSSKWKFWATDAIVKSEAWDDQSASFPVPAHEFTGFPHDSSEYRVITKLYWYKADGTTVAGWVKARYNWYTRVAGTFEAHAPTCTSHQV